MHPRLLELFDYLDEQHTGFLSAVTEVPPDRQRERPADDSWSVAEVVEHLAILEQRLTPLFGKLIAEARKIGLADESDSTGILVASDPGRFANRARKIATPEATRPTGAVAVAAGLAALDRARRDLKDTVLAGDGLALATIMHPHPAFGPMNLYQWVAFVGAHMARHAAQVREIGESLSRDRS